VCCSTPHWLEDYVGSLELELGDDHYKRLDEVSAIRLGTPHEDVVAALSGGGDGDRTLLQAASPVPVVKSYSLVVAWD
jgi:hypothetical protein